MPAGALQELILARLDDDVLGLVVVQPRQDQLLQRIRRQFARKAVGIPALGMGFIDESRLFWRARRGIGIQRAAP